MFRLSQISNYISSNSQKFIIIFGAPGVGKGTYSKMLAYDLGFNHVSTGDQIRKIINGKVRTGFSQDLVSQIKNVVSSGGLVSDQIVIKIIEEKISDPQSKFGIILDGFPRTYQQLVKYINKFPLHSVLNLQLRKDVLFDKLMGRRTCKECGTGFNVCDIQRDDYSMEPMLPKVHGKCDKCNGDLIMREDDQPEIIQSRFKQYQDKTKPLLLQFQKTKKLVSFECKKGVKDYPQLKQTIIQQINKHE